MAMNTEDKRRAQRWEANFKFAVLVVVLLVLGALMGYGAAKATEEPMVLELPQEVKRLPVITMQFPEPEEKPAENYSSLEALELVGTFTATAYCPCVTCCGIWSEEHPNRGDDYVQRTAAGTIPEEGRTIAADWSVLPQGTEVVIDGHTYTVEDTGSAIKGNRIDLYFESHQTAVEWGVQTVDVYREAAK